MCYKIFLETKFDEYLNDAPEIIKAFSPKIELVNEKNDSLYNVIVDCFSTSQLVVLSIKTYKKNDNNLFVIDSYNSFTKVYTVPYEHAFKSIEYKKHAKSFVKKSLYCFMMSFTCTVLPYGVLSGVRPTKLFRSEKGSYSNIISHFMYDYNVSQSKTKLIQSVVANQTSVIDSVNGKTDIFINIPICPTKCKYCSFITTLLPSNEKLIDEYVNALSIEMRNKLQNIDLSQINAIYVGGGTPTSISVTQLRKILGYIPIVDEITVEAGRPDCINEKKLNLLAEFKVSRISINPQSFNDKTLSLIGRSHTSKQIFEAYSLAKQYNFDINMDLIAGLPYENMDDFKKSIDAALSLNPDNITIHTLAIKKGSTFMHEGLQKNVSGLAARMVEYSQKILMDCGYMPYYMYRQKNMIDNLENVGFAKTNKICKYNVGYMEELTFVIGLGAGAMSKNIDIESNAITRNCNAKNLQLYITRIAHNQ